MTTPIFDGHNDALLALYQPERGQGRSFFEKSEHGHLDLPRARAGGMVGGLFAVFVPPLPDQQPKACGNTPDGFEWRMTPALPPDHAREHALAMVDVLEQVEHASEGAVRITRTADEIDACIADGVLSATVHFEGAEAITPDLSNLPALYERGLRSLGITWSRPNAFGSGVPFTFPSSPDIGPGLTDAGKALVRECNRLGILLDVSHLNERGFWDVIDNSSSAIVASHSNAHALCPSPRNLTDDQLRAVAETGGLVGITYAVVFLRDDGANDEQVPLSRVVEHVRYVADRIGVEHVGLGSDFDGAKMPAELRDAGGLQKLVRALRDADFSDAEVRMICGENWRRVLRQVWR